MAGRPVDSQDLQAGELPLEARTRSSNLASIGKKHVTAKPFEGAVRNPPYSGPINSLQLLDNGNTNRGGQALRINGMVEKEKLQHHIRVGVMRFIKAYCDSGGRHKASPAHYTSAERTKMLSPPVEGGIGGELCNATHSHLAFAIAGQRKTD